MHRLGHKSIELSAKPDTHDTIVPIWISPTLTALTHIHQDRFQMSNTVALVYVSLLFFLVNVNQNAINLAISCSRVYMRYGE